MYKYRDKGITYIYIYMTTVLTIVFKTAVILSLF